MRLIARLWRRPLAVIALLWLIGLVVWLVAFFSAALAAADAQAAQSFPQTVLGMPVLESYYRDGGHGMEVHWGSTVLLVVPVIVGAVAAVDKRRRGRRERHPSAPG